MILSHPRKSDTILVFIGLIIFVLLILGVFFVIRKQPETPKQSPGRPASSGPPSPKVSRSLQLPSRLFDFGHRRPVFAQAGAQEPRQALALH